MRRLLYCFLSLVAIVSIVSCEKEEQPKPTTYTVTMAMSSVTSTSIPHYDLTAYEYNEAGEKVANNALSVATSGTTKTFTANPRSVKVKLYIKMYTDNSGYAPKYYWVQQVFYLEEGNNIEIKVDDHTKVGSLEP